jgi:hypothetical protein
MKIRFAAPLVILAVAAVLAGCGSDSGTKPGFGSVRVSLTDAPADYDQVNIVVREVRIHAAGEGDGDGSWIVVRPDSESTYDLLELRNGVFVTLGFEDAIPAGSYDQVRLVLGAGSNVVIDGVTHPLVTPSGQQSGIKVNGGFEVIAGETVEIVLDFDASRSIHQTGNGKYMLRPVIRATQVATSGAIHGDLDPATDAEVHAIVGADTVRAIPDAEGLFTLSALPGGTYDVVVDVVAGYRDTTLTGVVVTTGHTTDLGVITLSPDTTVTPH